jgi:hypothetical protein
MGAYGETDQYLAECQAYPGNSGAPIYVNLPPVIQPFPNLRTTQIQPPRIALLGVVTGFYPDRQKVMTMRSGGKVELQVYTHFGISSVTPVNKIHDILYSERAMKERKEWVSRRKELFKQEPASMTEPQEIFTKEEFENVLRQVSRRVTPSQSEQSSSGT